VASVGLRCTFGQSVDAGLNWLNAASELANPLGARSTVCGAVPLMLRASDRNVPRIRMVRLGGTSFECLSRKDV